MGIGDEIIASGHAKRAFGKTGQLVMICDSRGKQRWSEMWRGLSWVAHPHHFKMPNLQRISNGARCRPYIDYRKGFTRQTGMNYSGWRVRDNMGFIQLNDEEMRFAAIKAKELGRFVVVEPLIEANSNPNKQWGHAKWKALVSMLEAAGLNPIHMVPPGTLNYLGLRQVFTPTIRHAAALMKFARRSILPDAGLQHVAGVLGLPATVIWGGANDPDILGYPEHDHIYFPAACRVWLPCAHCRTIWTWLKPEYVFDRVLHQMRERHGENF